jgi:hypothetical protein
MKSTLPCICLLLAFLGISFMACKKDGMNSAMAKKIQYRWEYISSSTTTDYLDGSTLVWTVSRGTPGIYTRFDDNAIMYQELPSFTIKYYYKVDGEKILFLAAGSSSRPTTPQYTDTSFIRYVDDNLLVLSSRKYFSSGAYAYIKQKIDSLKR